MRVLITGAAGFFGHHLIRYLLDNTKFEVEGIDALTYAGHLDRLRDNGCLNDKRVRIHLVNFNLPIEKNIIGEIGPVDYILHCGAETHVDDSIQWPEKFVTSNVLGTTHMLQWARKIPGLKRFVYFSTDEVYGPAPEGVEFKETDPLNPTNPYSASKAAGEMMVRAFGNTYKVPWIITRTMNLFGERQHPQKFIPLVIRKIFEGGHIRIHSSVVTEAPGVAYLKAGSRNYIHCRNAAAALMHATLNGVDGGVYNITGEKEVDNEALVKAIYGVMQRGRLDYELTDFHEARPGHDPRYAVDGSRLAELGFTVPQTFDESLKTTVDWYMKNPWWLNA